MKDTAQRCWAVALGGHGVNEAGRVLGPLLHRSAPASALGSQGMGTAQELTKGAFGWGSPPKFKKRSKRLCQRNQASLGLTSVTFG